MVSFILEEVFLLIFLLFLNDRKLIKLIVCQLISKKEAIKR